MFKIIILLGSLFITTNTFGKTFRNLEFCKRNYDLFYLNCFLDPHESKNQINVDLPWFLTASGDKARLLVNYDVQCRFSDGGNFFILYNGKKYNLEKFGSHTLSIPSNGESQFAVGLEPSGNHVITIPPDTNYTNPYCHLEILSGYIIPDADDISTRLAVLKQRIDDLKIFSTILASTNPTGKNMALTELLQNKVDDLWNQCVMEIMNSEKTVNINVCNDDIFDHTLPPTLQKILDELAWTRAIKAYLTCDAEDCSNSNGKITFIAEAIIRDLLELERLISDVLGLLHDAQTDAWQRLEKIRKEIANLIEVHNA